MKDLVVFTTGVEEKLTLLRQSCERVGVELRTFSAPWTTYVDVKLKRGIEFLATLADQFEYAMWVDAHDSLVAKDAATIMDRHLLLTLYSQLVGDEAVLISAEASCWPDAGLYPPPYLNAGGFMGPLPMLHAAMQTVLDGAEGGDDQRAWTKAYIEKTVSLAIDKDSGVFYSANMPMPEHEPCVLHWNGNQPGREEYWSKLK